LAGIFVSSFLSLGYIFAFLFIFLAGINLLLVWWFRNYLLFGIALFFVGLALGVIRFEMTAVPVSFDLESKIGQYVTLTGRVITSPQYSDASVRVTLWLPTEETKVLVSLPVYSHINYGDRLWVRGTLTKPTDFTTDLGKTFPYEKYLLVRQIRYQLSWASIDSQEPASGLSLVGSLFKLKEKFIFALSKIFPEPHSALGAGILLGVKESLGRDFEVDLRRTGIIHIVVLSGYNVTVIALFIMTILSFLPKRFALFFGALGIISFAIMVGGGPTVVRATLMALLALLAKASGRLYDVTLALILAGVVMVWHSPLILVYDIGFQLSFMATLGLIYLSPLIEPFLSIVPKAYHLRELTATTLAAQVSVLPWILYQIGELSLASVPVNLLILPIVPLAMLLTFLSGLLFFVIPSVVLIFSVPAYFLLEYMVVVVSLFASVPLAILVFVNTPLVVVFLLYSLLFVWVWRNSRTPKTFNVFGDL